MAVVGTRMEWGLGSSIAVLVGAFVSLFITLALGDTVPGVLMVFVFTGTMGLSLGPVLQQTLHVRNGSEIIGMAVGLTGLLTFALSGYVLVTKKNFNFLGGTLFAGLIVVIAVSIAGMFFHEPALNLAISVVSAVIFCGYILYDTSRIVSGEETSVVSATLGIYLDIVNLFLNVLEILLSRSDD
jgi:modulator of FtsH protease